MTAICLGKSINGTKFLFGLDNGREAENGLNNRQIVPYYAFLRLRYNCRMSVNVEVVDRISAIKNS